MEVLILDREDWLSSDEYGPGYARGSNRLGYGDDDRTCPEWYSDGSGWGEGNGNKIMGRNLGRGWGC